MAPTSWWWEMIWEALYNYKNRVRNRKISVRCTSGLDYAWPNATRAKGENQHHQITKHLIMLTRALLGSAPEKKGGQENKFFHHFPRYEIEHDTNL